MNKQIIIWCYFYILFYEKNNKIDYSNYEIIIYMSTKRKEIMRQFGNLISKGRVILYSRFKTCTDKYKKKGDLDKMLVQNILPKICNMCKKFLPERYEKDFSFDKVTISKILTNTFHKCVRDMTIEALDAMNKSCSVKLSDLTIVRALPIASNKYGLQIRYAD